MVCYPASISTCGVEFGNLFRVIILRFCGDFIGFGFAVRQKNYVSSIIMVMLCD